MAPNSGMNSCDVNKLPSKQIYNYFERGNNDVQEKCPDYATWVGAIEGILEDKIGQPQDSLKYYTAGGLAKDIAKAWCNASNMIATIKGGSVDPPRLPSSPCKVEVLCDFFYFWLGDLLHDKLNAWFPTSLGRAVSRAISPKEVMKQIFETLNGSSNNLCAGSFMNSSMEADFNTQRRKIFDYYYDHRTIWNNIKNNQSAGSGCAVAYTQYLNDAQSAYGQLDATNEDPNDHFWTNLWKPNFKDKNDIPQPHDLKSKGTQGDSPPLSGGEEREIGNLLSCLAQLFSEADTLKSKGQGTMEGQSQEVHGPTEVSIPTSPATNSTLPATAVSSAVGLIGLPTVAFALYKYTDVFDGIKKSLFGGSNNTRGRSMERRSIGRRQHFDDTFTENDSSTLGDDGSTTLDGGGGGGDSSTLGGSSTDISTIYNEPPRRPIGRGERAGTNNRRPGNIRYYAT
ncbi:KIR protein [Plasmodium knowlesi strain H]|uniref:KIR protein n=2 Tax=Plasmodium knowlesi (strain H) TaxID=5851 RepID=A0A5K1VEI2_PLAKH|nr:KIR protein [Plasmodium knowlesi strain H]CAA9986409.1 KIR protein [Plasmodium knowlesi strain H]SBO27188.1 KIR protein [Plasmodium knowlesi strain H]SBO29544.1 KIR protein [Plasmodium knowlesi strain H]VVS75883.1 KIR protein [Plasmodium knowlesi strain H]|eukprot:XP_002257815.1 KIR protein [Plasmodium knowlesi strain H]